MSVDKETSNECVSATGEVRSSGHGVADYGFAFQAPGRTRALAGLPLPFA